MLHFPVWMLKAALLSKIIMNCKHAYSDSFLRKVLVHNKVIVSVGVNTGLVRARLADVI